MQRVADVRERESLSDIVDVLLAGEKDLRFLSLVNMLPNTASVDKPIIAQKHEWNDVATKLTQITLTSSEDGADWDTDDDTTDLPVDSDDVVKLAPGDILLLDDDGADSEQVIVKSVNTSANTIDLYARGHGATTASVQGHDDFEATVIGHAAVEGGDPQTAYFQGWTTRYNYTQIFEDTASISGTLRRSLVPGGNALDQAIAVQLKEQMRLLNKSMIHGNRNLDEGNNIATMGGLREWLTETKDFGSACTKALLEAAVVQAINAGCNPDAIHASPTVASQISQLYEGQTQPKVGNARAGFTAQAINLSGLEIMILPDRDMPSTEALLLDYDRVSYGPLEGGERGDWASYVLWDKQNLNQSAKQVGGEFTLQVRNPGGAGLRMYGVS